MVTGANAFILAAHWEYAALQTTAAIKDRKMPNDPSPREIGAAAMRARFILDAAAGMGAQPDEPYREPEVALVAEEGGPPIKLSASSTLDGFHHVMEGKVDLAFLNPSAALTVAYRGKGSYFTQPQPVRAITVLPSRDQCLFAVNSSVGLSTIEDVGRVKYPLKIGVRSREGHWLHFMLEDIFAAAGFSVSDLISWGGEVVKVGHIPRPGTEKFEALKEGQLTAVFDEGVHGWADALTPAGLKALKLEEETLTKLEKMGYRQDFLRQGRYPTLPEDIPTLDFSGWPIFVREDAHNDMVTRFCAGLEARRELIPWEGDGPLPLDMMCGDTPEAPLGTPLHPAAESFWKSQGYL